MTLSPTEEELFIRTMARRKLETFVRYHWPTMANGDYCHNWSVSAICDHLEALFRDEIDLLVINISPRSTKSTLCNVAFPAWAWLQNPQEKTLNLSMSLNLSSRDSRVSRLLIESEKYRAMKEPDMDGLIWELSPDNNQKNTYSNTVGGIRQAVSIDSSITGKGCTIQIIDDANDAGHLTDPYLEKVRSCIMEVLPTRFDNPDKRRQCVIQQRVHEWDVTGILLESVENAVHLNIPAYFEAPAFVSVVTNPRTGKPWTDPRTKTDELFWPARWSEDALEKQKRFLGERAFSAQFQQDPSPKDGGMFREDDFIKINGINPEDIQSVARGWDCAATTDGGDWTVGALLLRMVDGTIVIADIIRIQESYAKRERRIKQAAVNDVKLFKGKPVTVIFEQEAGSAGKDACERRRDALLQNEDGTPSKLAGHLRVVIERPTGDKVVRAEPLSIGTENHLIQVLDRPWTSKLLREFGAFPLGRHDDQVDACAYAYNFLKGKKVGKGSWGKGNSANPYRDMATRVRGMR